MPLNSFIFSFNVVMPVFLVMSVGYFLKGKALDAETTGRLNWLMFNCALPVMLFRDIANSDFTRALDVKLILFAVISTLIVFSIAFFIAPKIVKPEEEGAFIQGAFRGNYAIIGLQLISNIMGGAQTGKAAMITTFIIPTYNILAVLVLTVKSGGGGNAKALEHVKKAGANIIKNPLIIGILAGIPFSALRAVFPGFHFPPFLQSGLDSLAGLATPMALLVVGATINMEQVRHKFRPAAIAASVKLIWAPLIFVPIAIRMGFRGEQIAILYVMFSAPAAVGSYIMAEAMGNDSALAANIVLLTTLGALVTFTVGVFWLRAVGAI